MIIMQLVLMFVWQIGRPLTVLQLDMIITYAAMTST